MVEGDVDNGDDFVDGDIWNIFDSYYDIYDNYLVMLSELLLLYLFLLL